MREGVTDEDRTEAAPIDSLGGVRDCALKVLLDVDGRFASVAWLPRLLLGTEDFS